MKTQKIILAITISLVTVLASGQSINIQRSISKDVQKISNKSWLSTEHLLTVASVGYTSTSKGVQIVSNKLSRKRATGNMISTGYPLWIISKGVNKLSRPAKVKPAKPLIKKVIV